jgi:hypothetical protein
MNPTGMANKPEQTLSIESGGTLTAVGWMSRHKIFSPPVEAELFFLTSLLIELIENQPIGSMSVIAILQQSWQGGLQSSSICHSSAPLNPGRGFSIAVELDGSHRQLVLEYLYGLTGGFSRSQCSTHFTVLTSTSAFLCPEKLMSGRMNSVCGPLATLKEQLKLIDCTPRSLHSV